MKKLSHIALILCFVGCSNNDNNIVKPVVKVETESVKITKSEDIFLSGPWIPKHADTTGYLCEVSFENDFAIHWYNGQCLYYYFTYKTGENTIDLLWSYKTDCLRGMDFLEKTNGVKKFPKHGEIFATYNLINDSLIKVDYKFPEWAKKVNLIAKDSIFPTNLYLNKGSI